MSLHESPLITQTRHRDYLESAVCHLEEFKSYRKEFLSRFGNLKHPDRLFNAALSQIDFAAESLRYAARAIGTVSGSDVSTEEVLGAIFSSFCVGK